MSQKYSVIVFAEESEKSAIDIAKKFIHKFQQKGKEINLIDLRYDLTLKTGFVVPSQVVNKLRMSLKKSDKIIFIYSSKYHQIPSAIYLFITQIFLGFELPLKKKLLNIIDMSPDNIYFSRFALRSATELWWKRFIQPKLGLPLKIFKMYNILEVIEEKKIKKIDFRIGIIADSIID